MTSRNYTSGDDVSGDDEFRVIQTDFELPKLTHQVSAVLTGFELPNFISIFW